MAQHYARVIHILNGGVKVHEELILHMIVNSRDDNNIPDGRSNPIVQFHKMASLPNS